MAPVHGVPGGVCAPVEEGASRGHRAENRRCVAGGGCCRPQRYPAGGRQAARSAGTARTRTAGCAVPLERPTPHSGMLSKPAPLLSAAARPRVGVMHDCHCLGLGSHFLRNMPWVEGASNSMCTALTSSPPTLSLVLSVSLHYAHLVPSAVEGHICAPNVSPGSPVAL